MRSISLQLYLQVPLAFQQLQILAGHLSLLSRREVWILLGSPQAVQSLGRFTDLPDDLLIFLVQVVVLQLDQRIPFLDCLATPAPAPR